MLGAIAVSALVTVATRQVWAAGVLAVLSALWLPVNNGGLEGPVLMPVTHGHGLTAMDLVSCAGTWLAIRVCRRSGRRSADWVAVGCVVILALGFLAAYLIGSGGVERYL
jgi:hypothetical protein